MDKTRDRILLLLSFLARLIDKSHTPHFYAFFFASHFLLVPDIPTNNQPCPRPPSIVMTSSSPTPDISSLSLSSQRLHDTYDYDGTGAGNIRPQYHFATSPPVPPSQSSPFHPLSMNQSPLKTKTSRAGLPSVRSLSFSPHHDPYFFLISIIPICTLLVAMARWRCYYLP